MELLLRLKAPQRSHHLSALFYCYNYNKVVLLSLGKRVTPFSLAGFRLLSCFYPGKEHLELSFRAAGMHLQNSTEEWHPCVLCAWHTWEIPASSSAPGHTDTQTLPAPAALLPQHDPAGHPPPASLLPWRHNQPWLSLAVSLLELSWTQFASLKQWHKSHNVSFMRSNPSDFLKVIFLLISEDGWQDNTHLKYKWTAASDQKGNEKRVKGK